MKILVIPSTVQVYYFKNMLMLDGWVKRAEKEFTLINKIIRKKKVYFYLYSLARSVWDDVSGLSHLCLFIKPLNNL